MRYLVSSLALVAALLLAIPAVAQDSKQGDDPYAGMREKIIKEFDKDGDGKLSEEEREAARGRIRELRIAAAEKQEKQTKDAPKKADKPAERAGGFRGPVQVERVEGRDVIIFRGNERDVKRGMALLQQNASRPGRGGPPGMPSPEAMFKKFDADSDGKLTKDEFMAMTKFVHSQMPMPGAGMRPPGGSREARAREGARKAQGTKKGAKAKGEKKSARSRGPRDGRDSRERLARADFRGPGRGHGFGRAGGPPSFGPRFAGRGFGPGGPGAHFRHFQWQFHRSLHDRDRFAHRGGSTHRGRGGDGDRGRDFRGPDRRHFAADRGPGSRGTGRAIDGERGPRGGRDGFRGPGPHGPRLVMHRPDGPPRDGDRPPRDGDRNRVGRPGGPPPGEEGASPRREGRARRDGEREGPPGPPRGEGEGRRRGPDGPPPRGEGRAERDGGPRPPRDGEARRGPGGPSREGDGPRRDVRRPDGPPPGDGPERGERAGRRGEGPPDRGGDRPGRGGPPGLDRGPRGPGGPPPGDGPGARGDGPRGPRGEGRGGEDGAERGDRRGPPRDRERGEDERRDRRPPRPDGDGDGKGAPDSPPADATI